MWEVIIPAVASTLGYLVKHFLNERSWKRVQSLATEIVKSPEDTTEDPREAVVKALTDVMKKRIDVEAGKVKTIVNGVASKKNEPDHK